jgi:NADH-quinone oxidoreductase subunit N
MNPLADPQIQEAMRGTFRLAVPEIVLLVTACLTFVLGSFYNRRWLWFLVSLLGVGVAAILAGTIQTSMPEALTSAPQVPDAVAGFIRWLALIFAAVFLFVSLSETNRTNAAEYFGCSLVAAAGVSLAGRANDLVTLFLALELLSIPTYVLLYLPAKTRANQEAAAKYFYLSVLSSAVLLFGFSYLYGLTGTTNLTAIAGTLARSHTEALSPMALIAAVMILAGIGFRITAVPFHFYAPDVYEGGPTGVVAQIAFWPKVAGFAALIRLFGLIADPLHLPFEPSSQVPLLIWIIAVVTMTFGNVMALLQDNIRRMLAYSGVAHGGYLLIGIITASSLPDARTAPSVVGIEAILVYLAAYGAMTVGAFAVIQYLSVPEQPVDSIDDLAGLGTSHPVLAASMAVFLFSLIGLPLTAGFVGKFLLFLGAMGAPSDSTSMRNLYQVLAVVAAVNAAIGAVYYLRVVGVMYLRTALRPLARSTAFGAWAVAVVLAGLTLVFGMYPHPIVKAARHAAPLPVIAR